MQNFNVNLQINFIPRFSHEILNFKESCIWLMFLRSFGIAKKSRQSITIFFRYCPSKNSTIWLAFWVCLTTPKWKYQIVKNFNVYMHAKINFITLLKNATIWLTESILAYNSRIRILPKGLRWNINSIMDFHFRSIPEKCNDNNFQKF